MPYIHTHDSHLMFYRDIGPNTAPNPIILLHGFGMQSLHWLPFAYPLSKKSRFIIPDLRGFGHSHQTPHNQDCVISNYAEDLAELIDQLELKQFKIAGISMGAFVALQYQGTFGDDKVKHYLHIDQSPKCINKDEWTWGLFGKENTARLARASELIEDLKPFIKNQADYSELPHPLRTQLWEDLGDFFASALSRPWQKHIAKQLCSKEYLIQKIMPVTNWAAYIHCLKAYIEQEYDMCDILTRLHAPTSLLVGMKSEMYPCGGQLRIADLHNNCEVIPFPNSGHTPLIDQPLRFYHVLKRFAAA